MEKYKSSRGYKGCGDYPEYHEKKFDAHDDTEFAESYSVHPTSTKRVERDNDKFDFSETGNFLGFLGIILSIVGIFWSPFILATAGIIAGVVSIQKDNRLGWWAIGIGVVVLVLGTMFLPFKIIF